MASATAFSMRESCCFGGLGTGVEDVLALVDGGLGEADGIGCGGRDARQAGDAGELAEDRDYGVGEGE